MELKLIKALKLCGVEKRGIHQLRMEPVNFRCVLPLQALYTGMGWPHTQLCCSVYFKLPPSLHKSEWPNEYRWHGINIKNHITGQMSSNVWPNRSCHWMLVTNPRIWSLCNAFWPAGHASGAGEARPRSSKPKTPKKFKRRKHKEIRNKNNKKNKNKKNMNNSKWKHML